jgi:hypothetical protein
MINGAQKEKASTFYAKYRLFTDLIPDNYLLQAIC